jgi:hypothetical protein
VQPAPIGQDRLGRGPRPTPSLEPLNLNQATSPRRPGRSPRAAGGSRRAPAGQPMRRMITRGAKFDIAALRCLSLLIERVSDGRQIPACRSYEFGRARHPARYRLFARRARLSCIKSDPRYLCPRYRVPDPRGALTGNGDDADLPDFLKHRPEIWLRRQGTWFYRPSRRAAFPIVLCRARQVSRLLE